MELTTNFPIFGTLWVVCLVVFVLWLAALGVWALREWTRRMK